MTDKITQKNILAALALRIESRKSNMSNNKISVEADETMYAVKEQINWARIMLKKKQYRKYLTVDEVLILQKIYSKGIYMKSDQELLNSILTKYNE